MTFASADALSYLLFILGQIAGMKSPAFPALIAMIFLTMAVLTPQKASALGMATRQCADHLSNTASLLVTALPERSRLDIMRMQQVSPSVAPIDISLPYTPRPCLPIAARIAAPLPPPAQTERQPMPMSDGPDVFGSVALSISHTPLDAKWRAAVNARFSKHAEPWVSFVRSVAGRNRDEQLQAVNQWVNARVRFTDDRPNKHSADRWSGAGETLRRARGDCEDYAIAKMKLLEAVGIAPTDMYLVIARDLVRRADHAVLVVRLGQRMVVLDNGTDAVLDARQAHDYRPIFSYGAHGKWIHGYSETLPRMASVN